MQDEINEKVVALSVKGAKLTAEMLQKAIKAIVRIVVHEWDSSAPKQGKAENIMIPILLFNVAIIEIRTMNVFPTSLKPLLWKRRFCRQSKRSANMSLRTKQSLFPSSRLYGMRANPSQPTTDSRKLTKPRNEWLNWMQRYRSSMTVPSAVCCRSDRHSE